MVGGELSITVKVTIFVVRFAALSFAVTMMECGPAPTNVPATGLCVMVANPQLSVAELPATTSGIAAWQLALAGAVESAGTESEGGTLSTTVIICVAVAE